MTLTYTDTKTDKAFSVAELDPGIRHFAVVKAKRPEGKSRNGKPFYPTCGIEYFETKVGQIEMSLWLSLIEDAFQRENLSELYEDIKDYVRENQFWHKDEYEIRLHAAECLCEKAYLAWKDFKVKDA